MSMKQDDIERYQNAVRVCAIASQLLRIHNIPEILRAIDHADTVGPVLDPSLWIKNNKKMQQDKKLLEAALPLAHFTFGD